MTGAPKMAQHLHLMYPPIYGNISKILSKRKEVLMKVNFFDLKQQNAEVKDEVMAEIGVIIDNNAFVFGPALEGFEREMETYCDTNYAVSLSSGTDALLIALMAIGIKPGDEVITTPFTFFATVGSIVRAGATPVFADIDPNTFNIDPADIERKITDKTKCIMPVHLYGQCADMDKINALAKDRGIYVIEDAAQAIGADIRGVKAGNLGDIGCFSFFPTKNLGGFGDAGMAVTNNEELYKMLKMLKNHGEITRYYHEYVGGNFRMDSFQAAALSAKLKRLDDYVAMRRQNAALYNEQLSGARGVVLPIEVEGYLHTYNQYVIKAEKRDDLRAYLADNGIGSQIYYPLCLHEQNCFAYLGYKPGDLPVAEDIDDKCLALPIYPELPDEEIVYVSDKIKEFYK